MPDSSADRPSALLTKKQREFLLGESDLGARGERAARARIRERVANALVDYIILEEHLPRKDIHTVFAPEGDTAEEVRDQVERNLVEGLKAQVRFVYRAADAGGLRADDLIQDAVDEAKGTRIEKLLQKLERTPQSLTIGELRELEQADEISPDESQELLNEALRPPEPGNASLDDPASVFDGTDSDTNAAESLDESDDEA